MHGRLLLHSLPSADHFFIINFLILEIDSSHEHLICVTVYTQHLPLSVLVPPGYNLHEIIPNNVPSSQCLLWGAVPEETLFELGHH
jgi:hypothetical protein